MHDTCHASHSETPAPRKCRPPLRGSSLALKRRIAAANAWSVSRNASAFCQRGGNGLRYGAIAALYMRKRRPSDEAGQHDDGERRIRGEQLRSQDLRRTGEDDRRHAPGGEPIGACGRRSDAAHQAERNQPDVRGQHFGGARAEVGR